MANRSRQKNRSRPDVETPPAADPTTPSWQTPLRALLIAAAVLWAYWPAMHGDWWSDDNFYYLSNPLLNDPARLWKAWFAPGSFIEYYPLHQTAQWIQWQLWHKETFGYHLTNVALHIVNALLVWKLLSKFGLRYAWIGGALFALHPLQVESVAWITEFKNTLSLAPFLLAACAIIDYEKTGRSRDYRVAFAWFVAAMLVKVSVFPFPLLMLLYVWWKRGRIARADLLASAPFFAIAFLLVAINLAANDIYTFHRPAPPDFIPLGGFLSRMALIGLSFSFYFLHTFWPVYPLTMYPQWNINPPSLAQFLPWPVFAGLLGLLSWKRRAWGRHIVLGLGFFALNLAPILGFKSFSFMRDSWVLDHFLYLPIIGLIGLVIAAAEVLRERLPRRFESLPAGITALAVALLAVDTHSYAGIFANEEVLWTYTLQHNPGSWIALNNIGNIYSDTGRLPEAIAKYEEALRIHPNYYLAHYNLGNTLVKVHRLDDAIGHYQAALKTYPDYTDAHNNLGWALLLQGRFAEAEEHFNATLRIDPGYAEAWNGLGTALTETGHLPEALERYKQALLLDPNNAKIHDNLGSAFGRMGQVQEAVEQYQQALQINPQDPTANAFMAQLQALSAQHH